MITWIMAAALAAAALTGCAALPAQQPQATQPAETAPAAESTETAEPAAESTETAAAAAESTETAAAAESAEPASPAAESTEPAPADQVTVRVGSLKGPTTMGLVNLMRSAEEGGAEGAYEFSMSAQPAEIAAQIAGGDLDIALLPANLASNLYHKTKGGVKVIDINTLGVLYCVTGEEDVKSIEDLAGKKVLMTGQGATPEYALKYLLEAYGITDCEVEFKSEATEIAALLKNDPVQTAILPQPFVTVATKQNEALSVAFSLTDAWDALGGDSRLLTGATIVRSAFLDEHPKAVALFLKEHAASAEAALSDIDGTAQLVADYGIIEKAPIAAAAIPNCSIVCITGEEMKAALEGYLAVLLAQSPEAVGGDLPAEDFYYIGE